MSADPVRAIADAVLYEGYILWPYRRSALKNQRRFTFGGVYPPSHAVAHPDDPAQVQTEVLLRGGPGTRVRVSLRFLHVVRRAVLRRAGAGFERVDELIVDGVTHLAWEEAVEREFHAGGALADLRGGRRAGIEVPGDVRREELGGQGALERSWRRLAGELCLRALELEPEVWRLTVTVANTTTSHPPTRARALEQTLCSSHLLLAADGGQFISLTDPPPELVSAAAACENAGMWPVLVGDASARTTMLASPIILEDYPRVAPESPGDLFDGGEIDQLLILNILALTEAERAEMAACDPRAREILERCEALTDEQLMALHGTIREFGMAR